MNRTLTFSLVFFIVACGPSTVGVCQESVFKGLRSDVKKADEYFQNESFNQALDLYLAVEKTKKPPDDIALKIARSYDRLRDNKNAAAWYAKHIQKFGNLLAKDEIRFAEVLSGCGKYIEALASYERYRAGHPDDNTVAAKIWRIKNIQYLYEDSTYYSVQPVSLTSAFSEFGPTYYQDGLIFVSNRNSRSRIQKIDGVTNLPFQTLFFAKVAHDSITNAVKLSPPVEFAESLQGKFHKGTLSFFPGQEKMIYTKSVQGVDGSPSVLQLFIAEKSQGTWKETGHFPYNSNNYSLSHPSLAMDGQTLYFVSDMPGGFGGRDIYKSVLKGNEWTKPENLGPKINSTGEETFPFFHNDNELYFASDSHGGFGGLDIFKTRFNGTQFDDPQNIGYPVNSGSDDFGIVLNSAGTRGFMSSNRSKGGLDDDIFELEIDLQSYPLVIIGTLSFKSSEEKDSVELQPLGNATMSLIDINNNLQVTTTKSDSLGNFSLEIPYSSQYKIEVVEQSIGKKFVSLQVPKNKKLSTNHQIVVIKDGF